MTEQERRTRSTEAFFGRRKGKPLRDQQVGRMETILPELKVDLSAAVPADLKSLFSVPVDRLRLEIGFGGGEHLVHRARNNPTTGFIGVEPFINSMAKLLAVVEAEGLTNIRVYDDDATQLLDWLPEGQIDQIDLLYADPWPKKRHWKRRFVSQVNLERFHKVLKPEASSASPPTSTPMSTGRCSTAAIMVGLNGRRAMRPTGSRPMRAGRERATRPRPVGKAAHRPISHSASADSHPLGMRLSAAPISAAIRSSDRLPQP